MTEFVNALILLTVFLALVAGHFFPWHVLRWRVLTDERGNLNRVPSYAYGVGCIWLGFWAWSVVNGADPVTVRALTWIVLAAAAGTIAPRGVRWLIEMQARMAEARERGAREREGVERGSGGRGGEGAGSGVKRGAAERE